MTDSNDAAGSNACRVSSPWLDTEAAALHLGIAPNTLKRWRNLRQGPLFHKVGGKLIRYHVDDLEAFARQNEDH